jgi:DNA-binding Xre family transcriptional regulator
MHPMMAEKIKFVMIRRNMTTTALAQAINTSPANLSNKLRRDDFRESELREIAKALNCTFESNFVLNDSGAKF